MNICVFGVVCVLFGTIGGMVVSSLMFAASDEDRCRDCLENRDCLNETNTK